MPLVRVRILHGTRLVGAPVRPFASEVTLQTIVDKALEGHPGVAIQSLEGSAHGQGPLVHLTNDF